MSVEAQLRALYHGLLEAWNQRDASGMAAPFGEDGTMVGFDGSLVTGTADIESHLSEIFAKHSTPVYVSKIRSARLIAPGAGLVLGVAGLIPPGKTDIEPAFNAIQTLVAEEKQGHWRIALFQNTPAAFHGRPDLVQELTDELRDARASSVPR